MQKEFTSKEAKRLKATIIAKLRFLTETIQAQDRRKTDMVKKGTSVAFSDSFRKQTMNSLHNPEYQSVTSAEADSLIVAIGKYMAGDVIDRTARTLDEAYHWKILEDLKRLSCSESSIKWLFSGAEKKEDAIRAYSTLSDTLQNTLSIECQKLETASDKINALTISEIRGEFERNREGFRNTFKSESGFDYTSGNSLDEIDKLLEKYKIAEDLFVRHTAVIEKRKESIKIATDRFIAFTVLRMLRDIPVDEINRDKLGIRIKALKDAGYETIGSLYSKSESSIACVNGISSNSANVIKRKVTEIANGVQKLAKIKLSVDDKSGYATELVIAIYQLIIYQENVKRLIEKEIYYQNNLKDSLILLEKARKCISWVFFSSQDKQSLSRCYYRLIDKDSESFLYEIKEIQEQCDNPETVSADEAWSAFSVDPIRFYNVLEMVVPGVLGNDDAVYGLPENLAREIQDEIIFPDGLKCTLRRYQEWGVKYILHQGKVLLGDEMGLGKTIQAIATMVSLKNIGENHFMVVCPASVLPNWCKEIALKSKLTVIKVHGSRRISAFNQWQKYGGVAVTTFETTAHLHLKESYKYGLLVVDEAHFIKNESAARSRNTRRIATHANRILFMTGTALENKVDEMVSLINALQPEIARSVGKYTSLSTSKEFRQEIAPVYYRRKREDVLTELPELIETEEWCELMPSEEISYEESVLQKKYADARRVSWNIKDLRYSSKAKRMKEIIEDATEDGRKILIFSFFLETISKIQSYLGDCCMQPINGSIPVQRRQQIIDEFEKAPAGSVLLAQIQSGGTGLNIQSASVVILCEPQFKPSIENQAISRAYRMGQTRNVLVHRLLCENTIDEKLTIRIKQKQELFDAFADKSVAADKSKEIDDKAFKNIIQEEIDRINKKRGA